MFDCLLRECVVSVKQYVSDLGSCVDYKRTPLWNGNLKFKSYHSACRSICSEGLKLTSVSVALVPLKTGLCQDSLPQIQDYGTNRSVCSYEKCTGWV